MSLGKVYLVGAGPGDPKLLTLRAAEVLAESNVVLVDQLVDRRTLSYVREGAEVIDVGKRAGQPCVAQSEIHRLLIGRARGGAIATRLKGGDPFIFGRGAEEAQALSEAGIPWEVVPGVTSGIAAAAYAGIPLLHRSFASRVTFISGHPAADPRNAEADGETVVVFMCGRTLSQVARKLIRSGRSPQTPVAIIQSGTREDQRVHTGTLATLSLALPMETAAPVLLVVGEVVRLSEQLHWFGPPPRPLQPCDPLRAFEECLPNG